jgi:drug/metabolite transporter (DMT)-like permease
MSPSVYAYAFLTVLCLASADFFLKLASTRVSNSLSAWLYACAALLAPTLWVVLQKLKGDKFLITSEGVLASLMVGISFSLVVVFLSMIFASGGNLSVAAPTIRASALVLASALGILVLGEPFTWRYALGVVLTLVGIYFIITR